MRSGIDMQQQCCGILKHPRYIYEKDPPCFLGLNLAFPIKRIFKLKF